MKTVLRALALTAALGLVAFLRAQAKLRTVVGRGANDAAASRPPDPDRAPTAEGISAAFDLGRALAPLTPVEGGFSHRVWKLRTDRGTFAVKQLNPTVIARAGALDRYRASERVAVAFGQAGVRAVGALHVDDDPLRSVEGSWCLAYPWIDAQTIPLSSVTVDHAYAVGATLGHLHNRNIADPRLPGPNMRTLSTEQWQDLAKRSEGQPWSSQLSDALALLVSLSAASAAAAEALRGEPALVSHRDLVPENVLWNAETAWLIDWESAAWTNPMVELVAAAIDWSGFIEGRSARATFDAVLEGYRTVAPFHPASAARALPVSAASWLRWLAYSVTRALGETASGDADRAVGVDQTILCLEAVVKVPTHQPLWSEWIASRA